MPNPNSRAKLRGTLAVAVLFTGLAAAKGIADAATPTTVQPVATSGSASDFATMSSDALPVLGTGSSALWASPLAPLLNAIFGCSGSAIRVSCPGVGSGVS